MAKQPSRWSSRAPQPESAGSVLARELRRLREEISPAPDSASAGGFLAWAERVVTAKGKPLDFDQFPYQRELYEVFGDPNVGRAVIMKAVQVGASELLVRLMLNLASWLPLTLLYLFPADRQLKDFRDMRIKRLIEQNRQLKPLLGEVDNAGLFRYGPSDCVLRGAQSRWNVLSVDADVICFDEFDELDPSNVAEAELRVAASELGLLRYVGVPSEPASGIASLFDQSDQREWYVSCAACGQLQTLDFDRNVRWREDGDRILDARRVCAECGEQLDVRKGKWLARYPDHALPGFHVHALMRHDIDLERLILDSKPQTPARRKNFYNNRLGLPYADEADGLDRGTLAALIEAGRDWNSGRPLRMQPDYAGPNLVTMGIDVAIRRPSNARISEHLDPDDIARGMKRCLWTGPVSTIDEMVSLVQRYQVNVVCIDAQPAYEVAQELSRLFPGHIYYVYYAPGRQLLAVDPIQQAVSVNRNWVIGEMVWLMHAKRNLLPEDLPDDWLDQVTAPRRLSDRDDYGRTTVKWSNRGRADDYFHAEIFDFVASLVLARLFDLATRSTGGWTSAPIEEATGPFRRSRLADYNYDGPLCFGPGDDCNDSEFD
jgi:phage terminase large subunit GpA